MKIFPSYCFLFSVSGVCLSCTLRFFLIGCAGSVGISLASWVLYISCVCVSAVWCAVPVQFYVGTTVVWAAGLYGFSFLSGSSGGYGTVETVRGGGPFFLCFL